MRICKTHAARGCKLCLARQADMVSKRHGTVRAAKIAAQELYRSETPSDT